MLSRPRNEATSCGRIAPGRQVELVADMPPNEDPHESAPPLPPSPKVSPRARLQLPASTRCNKDKIRGGGAVADVRMHLQDLVMAGLAACTSMMIQNRAKVMVASGRLSESALQQVQGYLADKKQTPRRTLQ